MRTLWQKNPKGPGALFPNGHAVFTLGVRSGIIVDAQGRRFANEMVPYDQMGRAMRAQMEAGSGDEFWFIFDDRSGDRLRRSASSPPTGPK
ncbi:FAD-binding protein [Nocardia sp. NPDC050193]